MVAIVVAVADSTSRIDDIADFWDKAEETLQDELKLHGWEISNQRSANGVGGNVASSLTARQFHTVLYVHLQTEEQQYAPLPVYPVCTAGESMSFSTSSSRSPL